MFARFKIYMLGLQASATVGVLMAASPAHAITTSASRGGGNNFSSVARNITESIEELPGLVTSVSYIVGIMMGVLGILKVKDHVENPTQTPLKDGAVRMAAGGALFGLPIVFESMLNTIGTTGFAVQPAALNRAEFSVR